MLFAYTCGISNHFHMFGYHQSCRGPSNISHIPSIFPQSIVDLAFFLRSVARSLLLFRFSTLTALSVAPVCERARAPVHHHLSSARDLLFRLNFRLLPLFDFIQFSEQPRMMRFFVCVPARPIVREASRQASATKKTTTQAVSAPTAPPTKIQRISLV